MFKRRSIDTYIQEARVSEKKKFIFDKKLCRSLFGIMDYLLFTGITPVPV